MRLIEWPPRPVDMRLVAYPATTLLFLAIVVMSLDLNRALFLSINGAGRIAPDWVWASLTLLGDTLVASALLVPVARRHPEVIWTVVLAALVATAYTRGLKPLLDLPRPPSLLASGDFNLIGPSWNLASFPSGHSSTIATLCGVLAIHARSPKFQGFLAASVIVVGMSRVLVGVHWPLDVIFGWLGGWLAACLGCFLYVRRPFWRGRRAHQIQLGVLLFCAIAVVGHDGGYAQGAWLSWMIGLSAAVMAAFALWESTRTFVDTR